MNNQTAAEAYLESRVMTAAPYQLHLLVVEAALRHARKAREALEQKDYEVSYFGLSKARECLDELMVGLNDEPLPEISAGMKQLFLFIHRCLRLADLTHDPAHVADGIKILEMHRDNWNLAIERAAREREALQNGPATSNPSISGAANRSAAASSGTISGNEFTDEPRSSFSLIS